MKISEIFKSLQGEGRDQGKPCIFVRMAGCNLNCTWCDTKYARNGGTGMTIDQILDQVWRLHAQRVCITGGEPLLQGEQLKPLLKRLGDSGYKVEIETNGTLDFTQFQPYATICMDVKCPSSNEQSNLSLLPRIRDTDSVKFVVRDRADLLYAEEVLKRYPVKGEILISPVEGSDYHLIVEWVLAQNIPLRFQLQLHKIIGVK